LRETLANYCWSHYCSVSLTFIISIFMSDYAKGLEGVIANESALSNVEGLDGRLSYLGYSIDELVGNCSFEETTYLLHFGKLPNTSELAEFEKSLRTNREIPQGVIDFLKSAPKDANPMDVLRTGVSMLGLFDKRVGLVSRTRMPTVRLPFLSVPKLRLLSLTITAPVRDWICRPCAKIFPKQVISFTSLQERSLQRLRPRLLISLTSFMLITA